MGLVIFRLQSLLARNKGKRTFRARFSNQNNGDFFTSCDVGWPHWPKRDNFDTNDWTLLFCFYTPVFRRDVLWYGDARPSVRLSVRPSVRPGLRPPIFRTFLLHALTYWAEILHMTLFYCTTDQVRVSSHCVNFWRSYASLWTKNIGYVQFSALFSYMLWHIELKFCIRLCFTVLQIKFECRQFTSILVGVMPLLELRILEIHSFPHFSLTSFDILSWKFAYDFVSPYYRSSASVVNLC